MIFTSQQMYKYNTLLLISFLVNQFFEHIFRLKSNYMFLGVSCELRFLTEYLSTLSTWVLDTLMDRFDMPPQRAGIAELPPTLLTGILDTLVD